MPVLQRVPRTPGRQATLARNLNATRQPASHVMKITVELYSAQDVVEKDDCVYVRSGVSPIRFYPVRQDLWEDTWICPCEIFVARGKCPHATKAKAYTSNF